MTDIKEFYIAGWQDQNFISPTPTYLGFIWSEALIQVPVMIWGWKALRDSEYLLTISVGIRIHTLSRHVDNPKLPLILLPFSCLIFITTGTLMVEQWFWPITIGEKLALASLYGPYLALCECR